MTVSVTLRRRKTALRGITPAKLYDFFNSQMVLHGYVDSSSSSRSTNVISDIKCNTAANRDLWIVDIINKEMASDFEELVADLTGWSVVSTIDGGGGDATEEEKNSQHYHHHNNNNKTSTIGGMKTNVILCNPSKMAAGNLSLSTCRPESKVLDHRRQDRISGSKRRSDDCYSSRGGSTHHHSNGLHLLSSLVGDERKILKTVSYSSQESSCISVTTSPSSEEEATTKTPSKRLRLAVEEKERIQNKTMNVVAVSSSLSSSQVYQSAANALMACKNSKDKKQSDRTVTCNRPFEMPQRPHQSSSLVATQGHLHPNEKPVYSVATAASPPIPTSSTRQRHDAKGENKSNRSASNDTNTTCVASENEATGSIQKLYSLMVEQQPSVNGKDDSIGKGGSSGAKILDGLKGHQGMNENRVEEEKSCGGKSAAAAAIVVNHDDAGDRNSMKTSRTGETNTSSSAAAAAASMPRSHNPSDPSSPRFDRQKYVQKILQQRSELKQVYQLREIDQSRHKRDIRRLVDANLKWKNFSRELNDKYETTHYKYQRYKQLYAISRSKLKQDQKIWQEQNIENTTMKTTIEILQYQLQQSELARKAASTKLAVSMDFADTCQRKYHDTVQKMPLQGQELQQEREKRIEAETRARHLPKQD